MKSHRVGDGERSLAVFIDFENMGLGFNNRRDKFEISKVLERLVEKGKIVAKKAYADWSRFGMYTGGLHEAAIELVAVVAEEVGGGVDQPEADHMLPEFLEFRHQGREVTIPRDDHKGIDVVF